MKFNQLLDDTTNKIESAQAVNFADLAKQAQMQAQFSQLQSEYRNYSKGIFIKGKESTLCRLD